MLAMHFNLVSIEDRLKLFSTSGKLPRDFSPLETAINGHTGQLQTDDEGFKSLCKKNVMPA